MGDLSIRDLVVEYSSGAEAVRPIAGLDLDVPAGCLAILLGPSGCGKTTLLSRIGGILKPTSGVIRAGNIDVTALDAHSLTVYRRNTVGIVFQAFNLVPSLTAAAENVMVPMRAAGMITAPRTNAPWNCWTGWACRSGCTTGPAICPVGSSSGSPSPAPSRWIRRRSWPTNPPRIWTSSRWRRCCG